MNSSSLSKAKTKDEFLSKAHEARQARDLARRQENAATKIQSRIRTFLTWRRLKRDTRDAQNELESALCTGDSDKSISVLRKILFFNRYDSDKNAIDSTIRLLNKFIVTQRSCSKHNELVSALNSYNPEVDFKNLVIEVACNNEESFGHCLALMSRLVDLCQLFVHDSLSGTPELHSLAVYVHVVNSLTSRNFRSDHESIHSQYTRIGNDLFQRLSQESLQTRHRLYSDISNAMVRMIKGPRTDAKSLLLEEYLKLSLELSEDDKCRKEASSSRELSLLLKLTTIPALIYFVEQYSPKSIKLFEEKSILDRCLELMSTNDQQLQSLTSTPALCLVANLVHLSSQSDDCLKKNKIAFSITITRLFDQCRRNMKQTISGKIANRRSSRKLEESTDESFNHILGWLTRETASPIDQETSKVIKIQLSHLWSVKFLKLLLSDLVSANENQKSKKINNSDSKAHTPKHIKALSGVSSKRISLEESQTNCDNMSSGTPITSFKRAVERAAQNMTKTIGYPYSKTTSIPGSHSTYAKLLTEETRRISMVCYMLHSSLKTLKMIKQDILTGLCFQDYVLKNLWDYISSLGSHNGLKAFLDHLAIQSKSNLPEFHILMLFCECASHIINILDDSELYEEQRPFTLDGLIDISAFLNMFVYRVITNQLVPYEGPEIDPILQTTHKLLTDLYKRDCRRKFAPLDHWLIKDVKMSIFFKDLDAGKPMAQAILTLLPHVIPHKMRVLIFRKLVSKDRARHTTCYSTFITIHRSRIVEDGYQQLSKLAPSSLKGLIRVKFINDHGLDEAGIDQDGVFKEFLEDTIKRVFDPSLNLFSTTSEQRLYPSPTSRLHEDHLSLFQFVGKMLGKAVYEGIVVDVPFASFFLSRVLGQHHCALYSPIDDLASLDPELYKNLIYIRHHDVSDLDLTFSIDQDMMGKIETYELEPGGKFIPVTNESRVRYIHSVAKFRMKTQIEEQTEAFVRGFCSIVNLEWLHMFSASEFQRLISGDTAPIDLQDLRKNTKYFGGFHNNHRVVSWLWDILENDFTPEEHRLFLKFVTSCSKPPLLGFANLEPPFSIRCVEVSDDQDLGDTVGSVLRGFFAIRRSDPVDRLPTSSTCFNLLKLPNYQRRSTLREKLRYAICSSPGFELS